MSKRTGLAQKLKEDSRSFVFLLKGGCYALRQTAADGVRWRGDIPGRRMSSGAPGTAAARGSASHNPAERGARFLLRSRSHNGERGRRTGSAAEKESGRLRRPPEATRVLWPGFHWK